MRLCMCLIYQGHLTYVNLIREKGLLDDMMPKIPIIILANKTDLTSTRQNEKVMTQIDIF